MFLRRSEISPLIEAARKEVGYRAQVNRASTYGRRAKFDGSSWNGSFLDDILRTAGLHEVSTVSTVTALGYYIQNRRLHMKPRVGDIVFYNFPTNPLHPFEQPHVGVVTDTSRWKTEGLIRAIEGETGTGQPRGSQEIDGVFERVRGRGEILGFTTPKAPKTRTETEPSENLPKLQASYFTSNAETRKRAYRTLHQALKIENPAADSRPQAALDNFRRRYGMLNKTGAPDEIDLKVLNRAIGGTVFKLGD